MARILYAVHGEGMGHAIRSKVVIEHLKEQKHEIIIAAGGRAFDFLSKHFDNVHSIDCYNIVYKNNRAMNIDTVFLFAKRFPKTLVKNFNRLLRIIIGFRPEIVITDFEPFSNFVSRLFKIPVIAIDNISIMLEAKISIPSDKLMSFFTAAVVAKAFARIDADRHIIPTFFYPELKNPKKTVLVPPVLRKEILSAKASRKSHILVYQTSSSNRELVRTMKKVNEKFVVYGFNKDKRDRKITFRKFSEKNFIRDLASCRAVIANGGFNVLSEAIYLRKPVLSIPVKNQFEQILNAAYVERLGYGCHCPSASVSAISNFVKKIPSFEKNLKKYRQEGNKALFREVDNGIRELTKMPQN